MMSLFSSFDYSIYLFGAFFLSIALSSTLTPVYVNSSFPLMISKVWSMISEFFYSLKIGSFSKSTCLIFFTFFFLISTVNFSSLWPWIFPYSSQLSFVLSMSMLVWASVMTFQLARSLNYFLSHLVPEGTPNGLILLLVVIELISNLIRPVTLTVRLLANILAGHIMMVLLSNLILSSSTFYLFHVALSLVEVFVSMIQAYIFSTMITLYFSEMQ